MQEHTVEWLEDRLEKLPLEMIQENQNQFMRKRQVENINSYLHQYQNLINQELQSKIDNLRLQIVTDAKRAITRSSIEQLVDRKITGVTIEFFEDNKALVTLHGSKNGIM